ncbi:DUF2897 family protein [Vibrio fluminensis]|uniref:DUF2897 family protein n=1 Tax=Vibrio fluminensis TaxID=2783614 RepID=UPI001887F318|nr:DUF2897 family protein [Vibrio fluminensis]
MDLLTNPWVIIAIVLAVIIGNISVLKYTANMKTTQMKKKSDTPKPKEAKADENSDNDQSFH